jgi:hypothetical protein
MRKPEFQKSAELKRRFLPGVPFCRQNYLDPGSGEYVRASRWVWCFSFLLLLAAHIMEACGTGQQFARGPAGRFRTTRWSVVLFSVQIAVEGRLGP